MNAKLKIQERIFSFAARVVKVCQFLKIHDRISKTFPTGFYSPTFLLAQMKKRHKRDGAKWTLQLKCQLPEKKRGKLELFKNPMNSSVF